MQVDDRRHSLLKRAGPVAQTSLDAGGAPEWSARTPAVPETNELLEVETKTALTRFGMPGGGWSLNPYTGCSHACLYCYVPDVARVERVRWGSYVIVKRNLPTVLAHELRTLPRDDIFLSSATDPYQPAEGDAKITRYSLEVLARAQWPLRVLTRSPLVLRDIDLLKRFEDVDVGLSVPTLDDEARRTLEPHAPPIHGRLHALRRLADEGLRTHVSFAPSYPLTGDVTVGYIAEAFRDAGVETVFAGPWRYMESLRVPLAARVRGTSMEPLGRLVEMESYYRRFYAQLREACSGAGLRFEVYGNGRTVKQRLAATRPVVPVVSETS